MCHNNILKTTKRHMNTDMIYMPVLCIPRVRANISKSHILNVFQQLNMGTLERIDIVCKQTERGELYNRVFVHYREWNNSENARQALQRLRNGQDIKVIHDIDAGFHWKISAYRDPRKYN